MSKITAIIGVKFTSLAKEYVHCCTANTRDDDVNEHWYYMRKTTWRCHTTTR